MKKVRRCFECNYDFCVKCSNLNCSLCSLRCKNCSWYDPIEKTCDWDKPRILEVIRNYFKKILKVPSRKKI